MIPSSCCHRACWCAHAEFLQIAAEGYKRNQHEQVQESMDNHRKLVILHARSSPPSSTVQFLFCLGNRCSSSPHQVCLQWGIWHHEASRIRSSRTCCLHVLDDVRPWPRHLPKPSRGSEIPEHPQILRERCMYEGKHLDFWTPYQPAKLASALICV